MSYRKLPLLERQVSLRRASDKFNSSFLDIRSVFKKCREFCVLLKIVFLFVNIYLIPVGYTCTNLFFQSSKNHFYVLYSVPSMLSLLSSWCSVIVSWASSVSDNKKMPQKARSGEYGGCGIISVLFLAKNYQQN